MPAELIRPLVRRELDTVLAWAAEEGWNPGRGDADAFWAADPDGFVALEDDGELIGAGSVVSYGGLLGFMGLFIVRPDLRGRGLGRRLWIHRRDFLRSRLRPRAAIGMDGVTQMRAFYEGGGFRAAHDHIRMTCAAPRAVPDPDLVPLTEVPFDEVEALDGLCFGVPRPAFLRRWIEPAGGLALGLRAGGRLRALGVARPCRSGCKVGPLFADDAAGAERVLGGLAAIGGPLSIDVPDRNRAAVELARRHGGQETFRCTRMYLGDPPPVDWGRVFGVTTLELG